jgi:imidazole glycerol-phosphate synthase subunit HisF
MQKVRIIPVVLLKNGRVVQSKKFTRHQILGNPSTIVSRLSNWFSDELVYLDISRDQNYNLGRDDLNYRNKSDILDIIDGVAKMCFMPLTVGGGIKTLEQAFQRVSAGADKITINTQAFKSAGFIKECVEEFGSQCVVVSIDAKRKKGEWEVYTNCGREATGINPQDWAKEMQNQGAGEILLNSIDQDGSAQGFDLELISRVVRVVDIPVIALGGAGNWEHFGTVIEKTGVSAVAASNIFQYSENSVYNANKYLYENNFPVRKPLVQSLIEDGVV